MRALALAPIALLLLALGCGDEGKLCSEDPDCQPSGCGPKGCPGDGGGGSGGGGSGGAGGAGGEGGSGGGGNDPDTCQRMCTHVYVECGELRADELGASLSFPECVDACVGGDPGPGRVACILDSFCTVWRQCEERVAPAACEQICTHVYDECERSLQLGGVPVPRVACGAFCREEMTSRQANCLLASGCSEIASCQP